jgi:hypothetical protein
MQKDSYKSTTQVASDQRPTYPGLLLKQAPSSKTFWEYLYGENKIYTLLMIFLMLCQYAIFKSLYPYPDFFSDSYSYLFAAYAHLNVNIWPIGYSKFLFLFHWFTHSSAALNFFQYMFLEVAALYFYHTVVYFYPTGKKTRSVLCLFLFFNPLNLYLANYVSSDSIFIGLSLLWLTQLIWIINRPQRYQLLTQAILIFIAFTFRYNAMYYPILSAIAIFLSSQRLWSKIVGTILPILFIIPFIVFSRNATLKLVGTSQFPPILGGWQWGNNALYMREYIHVDSMKLPSDQCRELDRIAQKFFKTYPPQERDLVSYVANYFFRESDAPLKQYMNSHYPVTNDIASVIAWGKVAPIFGEYGLYLIKSHPLSFARHYLLVNTKNYFLPPLEKLELYNLGEQEIWPIAKYWFGYPNPKINSFLPKTFQGRLLFLYPAFFMFLNLYFAGALFLYIRRRGFAGTERALPNTILLISVFMILNFCFSVFANIIVIRYQVFPMIVCLSSSMLLIDWLEASKDGQTSTEKKRIGYFENLQTTFS